MIIVVVLVALLGAVPGPPLPTAARRPVSVVHALARRARARAPPAVFVTSCWTRPKAS